ncbi:AraC family transcriptional regulator [Aequorivita sp. SDUM287046]|uniref:AraC family transcriptional regulator n=1 Tax=Aequorivita aurantiaca TaxID=3053356 RepID=A0ABT8DHB6_9FLAO|nr:AraC family transcriptional regulator [Aequorivita aurantiaca]MDN3724149.1 AraC family transcriptional regulator [Aequorivita aurantiaca]
MKTNELFSASARQAFASPNFLLSATRAEKKLNEHSYKLFTLGKGIKFLQCEFKQTASRNFRFPVEISNKYLFIFNLNDKLQFSESETERFPLGELHNFLYFKKKASLEIILQKNGNYKFCCFIMDTSNFESHVKGFVGENSKIYFEKDIMYKGLPNLKISDYLHKLLECKKTFPENLISLGYVNIIIGMLLNQYIEAKSGREKFRSCLREWEIVELQRITEEIRLHPEQNYSIKSLSRKSGVSIPKLQEGFKEMHGHTIANFIREVRLLKAEELLVNSDLNISEIVYTVGLCSRSYFSRIFKKKYKCTPTDYQRQQISLAVTA